MCGCSSRRGVEEFSRSAEGTSRNKCNSSISKNFICRNDIMHESPKYDGFKGGM